MLLDEPFAALDAMTRQVLQEQLIRIQERQGKTMVFITHSIGRGPAVVFPNRHHDGPRPDKFPRTLKTICPAPRERFRPTFQKVYRTQGTGVGHGCRAEVLKSYGRGLRPG